MAPGCSRTLATLVQRNYPCSLDPTLWLAGSDLLVGHHVIRKGNFIMPLMFICSHRKSESLQSYFRRPFQRTAALTSNHILCTATWVLQMWFIILMSWFQQSISFVKMVNKVKPSLLHTVIWYFPLHRIITLSGEPLGVRVSQENYS